MQLDGLSLLSHVHFIVFASIVWSTFYVQLYTGELVNSGN